MNKQNISILTILRIIMVAALLIFMIVLQVGNRSSNASLESVSQKSLAPQIRRVCRKATTVCSRNSTDWMPRIMKG